MKRLCFLLLLGLGLLVAWTRNRPPSLAEQRIGLLVGPDWVWTSWTEQTGSQPVQERMVPCRQDDFIRFAQHEGQQLYSENAGPRRCETVTRPSAQGQWALSEDAQRLTITGGRGTFDDTWQIDELSATRLRLAYRTTTSRGPFSMVITFTRRQ
ncbi:hypothetical protein E5K00_14035 [Hymenobacter aquaticus]|uniref:Lipocalin-like domain-containing protein n=1 Tax=Hymenobacter aquaticus TaxID=1867101 RepID=A0A4Z0PV90_9BACT|nr:lipocalin family protein [Hymenobacter aquaticus]TGE21405.1 hypothetical protein E5K00_14035 [Hymenobacter aquaticus]